MFSGFFRLFLRLLPFRLHLKTRQGSFPRPLSPEEEKEALSGLFDGNEGARCLLIEHNLRLVAHIAKKFYAAESDQDDLISIGTIGLIKAINTYKPGKNVKLTTYAATCIENEIKMHFRRLKSRGGEISLNEPIDPDKEGNTLELLDTLTTEDTMLEKIELEERRLLVNSLVSGQLNERERKIVEMRYGLCGSIAHTQKEVADKLGISRSYVSRLEKRALEKLEEKLKYFSDIP